MAKSKIEILTDLLQKMMQDRYNRRKIALAVDYLYETGFIISMKQVLMKNVLQFYRLVSIGNKQSFYFRQAFRIITIYQVTSVKNLDKSLDVERDTMNRFDTAQNTKMEGVTQCQNVLKSNI